MKKLSGILLCSAFAISVTSCGASASKITSYIEKTDFENACSYYIENIETSKKRSEIDMVIKTSMDNIYSTLEKQYSDDSIGEGTITYIQKLASKASFYDSEEYITFMEHLDTIDDSVSAYETGMSEYEKENYSSAIYYFESVNEIDSAHYSDAVDKVSECEELMQNQKIESIHKFISDGKYQDAKWEIDTLSNTDSDLANELSTELEKAVTSDIDSKIDSYFSDFNYSAAYEYLNNLYTNYEFESVKSKLNNLEDDFVAYSLSKAEEDVAGNNYEAASAIVKQAMSNLGEENEELTSAYNDYHSRLPIYITEMDYMANNGSLYIDDNITDNIGNIYHHSLHIDGWGRKEYWAEYYINGKYATFSGVVGLSPNHKDTEDSKYFEIYGDGNLIYSSPTITRSSVPENFTVDVSNIKVLKIYYPATDGNNSIATIYDGLLTPPENNAESENAT